MAINWHMAAAAFVAPIVGNLIHRYQTYQKPFDGSWTVARVLGLLRLGHDRSRAKAEDRKLLTHQPASHSGGVAGDEPAE